MRSLARAAAGCGLHGPSPHQLPERESIVSALADTACYNSKKSFSRAWRQAFVIIIIIIIISSSSSSSSKHDSATCSEGIRACSLCCGRCAAGRCASVTARAQQPSLEGGGWGRRQHQRWRKERRDWNRQVDAAKGLARMTETGSCSKRNQSRKPVFSEGVRGL